MFRLTRLSNKPILSPIKEHEWEKEAVFNAAVIYEDNKFHLFYRATCITCITEQQIPI
ncbi:hypothetical protein SAMN02745195_02462 [Thermoanaerobacter uzonensis DSM 18761]|uniref:Glycosidase n=1 Tax=Thermoanaerobacter uzonensis DSM 18761 TaxID=1123369 RepID=A0A1M5B1X1_9THEO|nr:hypothetical protein SAMN02745195_02462 [Thermoanaerobacter uzonensis DSM 18761]